MKKVIPILCCLFLWQHLNAQERIGLSLSNYSGVTSLNMNPAWAVNSPLKWDVNIVALGVFGEQDYFSARNGSILNIIKNGAEFQTDAAIGSDANFAGSAVPFFFNQKRNFDAHVNAFAMAPSFWAEIKGHSVGFYMQGRAWLSGYNIDGDLNYFNLVDSVEAAVGEINPFQVGAMTWGEIGFNYGREIKTRSHYEINVGGTAKVLLGYDAINVANNQTTGAIRNNNQTFVNGADVSASYATNFNNGDSYQFQRNGFGVATDLGVTIINRNAMQSKQQYKWKLGVSLIDVGRVWYRKNASAYNYATPDTSIFSDDDFSSVGSPDDVIDALNNDANLAQAVLQKNSFGMWMPMALGVQFDMPLIDRLYVSAQTVIGMRFKKAAIERSDFLAVTPRYEHKWFEMGIPLSVYRWNDFNIGTYLRMGPLTIGTESLNSWVMPGRFEGSDVYLSLKINSAMFKKWDRKSKSKSGTGCYSNDF